MGTKNGEKMEPRSGGARRWGGGVFGEKWAMSLTSVGLRTVCKMIGMAGADEEEKSRTLPWADANLPL